MKTVLFCIILLTVNQSQAQNTIAKDSSSHFKAAEDFMVALQMEQNINDGISQMVDMQIEAKMIPANKKEAYKAFLSKYMNWNVLKKDYLQIYISHFSEAEMKDLAAFYRTPIGIKAAKNQNELNAKISKIGQDNVQSHMAELMQLMQ
jgi:hypothetical protein